MSDAVRELTMLDLDVRVVRLNTEASVVRLLLAMTFHFII